METKVNQILATFRDFVTTHNYQETPILTAYVDVDPTDPANMRETPAWAIQLKNEAKKLADQVGAERLKRRPVQQQWEQTADMVQQYLHDRKPTGRSIVLFTDLEDYIAVDLPVKMPTRLYYGFPQVKHLLFALDQYQTYEVVLFSGSDTRLVEVYLSRASADLIVKTDHDKAWRLGRKSMEAGVDRRTPEFERRFVTEVAAEIDRHYLGDLEFERLIFGGNLKLAHAVKNALHPVVREIVIAIEPIDFKLPEFEIADLVKQIAENFENAYDLAQVEGLVSLHGRGGPAVIEQQGVEIALGNGQVKTLILPYPIDAEKFDVLMVDAIVHGVDIKFVYGAAADRLNEFGGIGARLYYSA